MSTALKPGHNGHIPEFAPARDILAHDPLTGKVRRETPDGPQNINTDRIEWLYAHDHITGRQYAAARRYQRNWELAEINPCGSSLMAGGSGSPADLHPNDRKRQAMKDHGAATEALGRLYGVVWLVVVENLTIPQVSERIGKLHKAVVSDRLDLGLTMLSDHYGFPPEKDGL